MNFWENAASSVTKAVDFIVDKNRKAAMMNRLKIVIRNEKEEQAHAYIQLGKYYYQNLRDEQNGDTEDFCKTVDTAGERLKRAYAKLDELAVPTEPETAPDDEDDDEDFPADDSFAGPSDSAAGDGFNPDSGCCPDAAHQEAADDEEDYLRPFTVVPNDGSQPEAPADEDSADAEDGEKPEE